MRLDPTHAAKLRAALGTDEAGDAFAKFDVDFMLSAISRLTPDERGYLMEALLRSARSRRLSIEQRVLLALFVPPREDPHA